MKIIHNVGPLENIVFGIIYAQSGRVQTGRRRTCNERAVLDMTAAECCLGTEAPTATEIANDTRAATALDDTRRPIPAHCHSAVTLVSSVSILLFNTNKKSKSQFCI